MSLIGVANIIRATEDFFRKIYQTLNGFGKILVLSKFNLKFPKAEDVDCFVLGNGPSLSQSLEESGPILENKKLLCVNNFASSSSFQKYKPSYYVMLDPGFFTKKERSDIAATFHHLKNNVDWPLTLFVPYIYKNDRDVLYFQKENKFVKISFYNYSIVKGFDFIAFFLFKKNLAMPQFYNVLGASIFISLNMGYKNVWVLGADHTWFKEVDVNEQNQLHIIDKHFYNKDKKGHVLPMIDGATGKWHTVGAFFMALHRTFNSYYILERYSKYLGSRIYNASAFSYIDAFERKKIKE